MIFDSREQRGLTPRQLRFALLCSLLLHGLLLSLGTSRPVSQGSAPSLIVRLRLAPAVMAPATPATATGQPRLPAHSLTRPRLPPVVLSTVSPARPEKPPFKVPASQSPDRALSVTDDALPARQSAGLAEPATAVITPSLPVAAVDDQREDQTARPPAAGLSADGLRRYRLGLATQSRRFKRYPAQALAAGWAGTAEIFLAVDSEGRATVVLNKSSGHDVLDRAAQIMIEAGAQRTPVPDALHGKAFSVILPVVFDINDG
ncbi:hypothetical protein PG1C_02655 [Rugosibacter aromaticivorans]|uniref:TonB C-terminal domain-containing protein n=1 Tax=Rugosibacter aromaticivorans TaxID=1565605 RepID=A0A0C5J7I8_9PROT|nr:TonB family protein [Rugosibacter aromaticivorans]AJP47658.1 hypothetical protein PG1C_02655 [Rugosibacter aromaticivorans]TBR12836.1 MAG: TonB family protein [Rugosibacter sp.]